MRAVGHIVIRTPTRKVQIEITDIYPIGQYKFLVCTFKYNEMVWYIKSTRKRTWKAKIGTNLQEGRKWLEKWKMQMKKLHR
jgi:hypothetical protein